MPSDTGVDREQDYVIPKNVFLRANHSFAGWNTVANGSGDRYIDEGTIPAAKLTPSITLYAQWTHNAMVPGPGLIIVPGW